MRRARIVHGESLLSAAKQLLPFSLKSGINHFTHSGRRMRRLSLVIPLALLPLTPAHAGILDRGRPQMLCHRNGGHDLPENTLASVALAARMGCDVIEIDVRQTEDGVLVLSHDGLLDRVTPSTGDVEHTAMRELETLDLGTWMSPRFQGYHIARFDDVLRLAARLHVVLFLDIKAKGIGVPVLAAVDKAGMADRVFFGGEWDDIRKLRPSAASADSPDFAWLQPPLSRDEVAAMHAKGKFVIGNFLSNGHEMDLAGMRAAVAAGADGIWVEYPRLGADALGRPVENTLAALAAKSQSGTPAARIAAIRELAAYTGFPTGSLFLHLLRDPDAGVSHAAAFALVSAEPAPSPQLLYPLLRAPEPTARASAAWALGTLHAPAAARLAKLLEPPDPDPDPRVVEQVLLALSRCPASSSGSAALRTRLLHLLAGPAPTVSGLAALALARQAPGGAAQPIARQLKRVEAAIAEDQKLYAHPDRLTPDAIQTARGRYRAMNKYLQALGSLPTAESFAPLVEQAFRSVSDYSEDAAGTTAGFQLWDRIAADPRPAITALGSSDPVIADRAEWALVKADPSVLPALRSALETAKDAEVRERLIRVLAWQGDAKARPMLMRLMATLPAERPLLRWAVAKIDALNWEARP